MIRIGDNTVSLDVFVASENHVCIMSVFDGSLQRIKSFCAQVSLGESGLIMSGHSMKCVDQFQVYITPITEDKKKFYHALLINKNIKTSIMVTTEERSGVDFYNYLMRTYDLPLMDWWGEHLLDRAILNHAIRPSRTKLIFGKNTYAKDWKVEGNIDLDKLEIYELDNYNEEVLAKSVQDLFDSGEIWISRAEQRPLEIENMDDYFSKYGHALVAALEKHINPRTTLNGNCDCVAFRNKRLFPQQSAMVNGLLKQLEVCKFGFMAEGMGVGKTLQATAVMEGYFNRKYMKSHPGSGLKDIYSNRGAIQYRNIIMAPGHTLEKWVSEISKEVPYAKAHILEDFSQLLKIKADGIERTNKEFWIVGKDFAKLSYMSRPAPSRVKIKRPVRIKKCNVCEKSYFTPDRFCPHCNNEGYTLGDTIEVTSGLVCPECGELLLEYRTITAGSEIKVLQPEDFANPTNGNSKCYYCGSVLWQPHAATIDTVNLFPDERHIPWYRATHYTNKIHNAKKSVWVHKKYVKEYFEKVGEKPLSERPDCYGVRKYSPAEYIKKYMKGYWDFAVFDEAHQYKGGGTGQGNAMEALVKSSKKQLALTGTIAGGVAQDLFFLLYRLDPGRMQEKGYGWNDVMKFNQKYGTLEMEYEIVTQEDKDTYCNVMTRGKQLHAPVVKPGISPLIFTDFLLDRSVFLDLADMSKYLPPLKEYVISVALEEHEKEMLSSYSCVLEAIKQCLHEKGGKKLMGRLLQFSLSYLDKPFGAEYIKHPLDGSIVCEVDQYPELWGEGRMLSKERELIKLLKKELDEGRNCFVYAEYTASPLTCVSYRLKELIEEHLGVRVAVLESASPEPVKREAWIHEQAEKNKIRVFITNPRCVETGLDFCWDKAGVRYNYPTIIFYQLGYSLYTVWQASRRHFRLIQTEECRTYYMGIAHTIQIEIIRLIAEKQVATSAIQGKFSTEGLAAMAQGVDLKVRLAQALAEQDFDRGNNLQEMFDILATNQDDDTTYDGYEPMKTVREIVGEAAFSELDESVEDEIDMEALLEDLMSETYFESGLQTTYTHVNEQAVILEKPSDIFALFS